ncbi:MAG: WD40 repeat domain-containing protein, partial [Gemmatimonadaceae bacterium]|nr:WD40 repeat domain-containing protein [Acetobacteraceae bacterium]
GTVHLPPDRGPGDWLAVPAHDGAVLSLAADTRPGFVTGGDDGRFLRIAPGGTVVEVVRFGSKWVEHVATFADAKSGVLACAVGKAVHVFDASGGVLKVLAHPSTVTGVAFDGKGKRIAASHYNGASLWFVAARVDTPRMLEWKGSHTGVILHPAADAVVTTMQENSLHGWRLADGQHMRMSGYPTKTASMSFTRTGKWLATSGAESIVLWPFFGGGPMGKSPTELAGGDTVICTRVACHPQHDAVAAGFSDGLVALADIATGRILPVAPPGRGPVSALAWSPDGSRLAFGSETGFAALVDFSPR